MQQDYADTHWRPDSLSTGEDEISDMLDELVAEPDALCRRKLADRLLVLITSSTGALSSVDFHNMQRRMLAIFSAMMDEMPDCPEKWGISFGVGTANCAGRSMSEIAAKLGTTRALISHRAVEFCRRYQLPPSPYMKSKR